MHSVSLDGRLLAYSVDLTGAERFTIMIKDLVSGDLLPDQISDTAYGVAWAKNNHLFYTRADKPGGRTSSCDISWAATRRKTSQSSPSQMSVSGSASRLPR